MDGADPTALHHRRINRCIRRSSWRIPHVFRSPSAATTVPNKVSFLHKDNYEVSFINSTLASWAKFKSKNNTTLPNWKRPTLDYNREAQVIVGYHDNSTNSLIRKKTANQAGIRLKNRYTNKITYRYQNNCEDPCSFTCA